jgi:hypothetical protein
MLLILANGPKDLNCTRPGNASRVRGAGDQKGAPKEQTAYFAIRATKKRIRGTRRTTLPVSSGIGASDSTEDHNDAMIQTIGRPRVSSPRSWQSKVSETQERHGFGTCF